MPQAASREQVCTAISSLGATRPMLTRVVVSQRWHQLIEPQGAFDPDGGTHCVGCQRGDESAAGALALGPTGVYAVRRARGRYHAMLIK